MDPIIEKAKADYAELSEQISRLSEKAAKLKAFLDIYDEPPPPVKIYRPSQADLAIPAFDGTIRRNVLSSISQDATTAKAKITNAVAEILSDGKPRHTRDLLEILKAEGIEPGATDKVIGLSNLLSRDHRFEADRSIGWSLKK